MRYRQLGQTGTQVSVLCLGAMTFGEADEKSFMHKVGSDREESFAVLDRALEAGINFVDTADVYGQDGLSERIFGEWLASRSARERVVVATKGRFRMAPGPNGTGASRMRIARAIDDSLKRLGTDRIDLYQIHMQDLRTPEEELLRALDDAVRAGKVVYFGASNYAAYRLMESLWVSDKRSLDRFVTLQAQYSLAVRALEREHVPLCAKFGLGILPWASPDPTRPGRRRRAPPAGPPRPRRAAPRPASLGTTATSPPCRARPVGRSPSTARSPATCSRCSTPRRRASPSADGAGAAPSSRKISGTAHNCDVQCTVPTAPPGSSMHERGLAIDFTSNGRTIGSRSSPAFQWLFGQRQLLRPVQPAERALALVHQRQLAHPEPRSSSRSVSSTEVRWAAALRAVTSSASRCGRTARGSGCGRRTPRAAAERVPR